MTAQWSHSPDFGGCPVCHGKQPFDAVDLQFPPRMSAFSSTGRSLQSQRRSQLRDRIAVR